MYSALTSHQAQVLPEPIPVRRAAFSERIDSLIMEIWKLGGKSELYANIERLKRLSEKEFEAELLLLLSGIKGNKAQQ